MLTFPLRMLVLPSSLEMGILTIPSHCPLAVLLQKLWYNPNTRLGVSHMVSHLAVGGYESLVSVVFYKCTKAFCSTRKRV